jgi:hypothetical protein
MDTKDEEIRKLQEVLEQKTHQIEEKNRDLIGVNAQI